MALVNLNTHLSPKSQVKEVVMRIRDLLWRGVSTWPFEFATSSQLVGEEWIL